MSKFKVVNRTPPLGDVNFTVTFLNTTEDDPDKHARIEAVGKEPILGYHIVNTNMPYMGSFNMVVSKDWIAHMIREKKMEIKKWTDD